MSYRFDSIIIPDVLYFLLDLVIYIASVTKLHSCVIGHVYLQSNDLLPPYCLHSLVHQQPHVLKEKVTIKNKQVHVSYVVLVFFLNHSYVFDGEKKTHKK